MLDFMAEQEAGNQQSFLELIGAPQGQIDEYTSSAQFPADVLYGAYGDIPGSALAQQGAAFGEAAGNLPGIFGNQLSFNQNVHSQQLAQQNALAQAQMSHARQMAAADMAASQSGGGGSGLTPYQEASLAMRAMEFQTEQDRYARGDELDWLKFEADLEQEELERQEKENAAAADSLLYMAVLNPDLLDDKKFMGQLGAALGMGSASAAGALTGSVAGAREDRADARAAALGRRSDKREDIRGLIGSAFNGLEPGMNKKNAISTIMGSIETEFPKFAGWKRDRVRNMVRQHVNSQWSNYQRGGRTGSRGQAGGFNKQWDSFEAGTTLRSAYKDYVSSLEGKFGAKPPPPSYKTAFARTMGAVRAKWGGKWNQRTRNMVAKRIHSYLRSQGLKRPPRRGPRPNMSGSGL